MSISEMIFVSSRVVHLILVPLLRGLASVFFAIAISKDCKARDNGSSLLWGLLTFISPVMFGIIYFVYSRLMVHRKPETIDDIKRTHSARRLTVIAIVLYIIALIIALVCLVSGAFSSAIALINDINFSCVS